MWLKNPREEIRIQEKLEKHDKEIQQLRKEIEDLKERETICFVHEQPTNHSLDTLKYLSSVHAMSLKEVLIGLLNCFNLNIKKIPAEPSKVVFVKRVKED